MAGLCSNKHTLHTAYFIEDGTPRWGELIFKPLSSEFEKYTLEEFEIKYKRLLLLKDSLFWSPKRNRFDMLLYYFFQTSLSNGTKIDLLLNFSAIYAPFRNDLIKIFWRSNLELKSNSPGYLLSLSAYYQDCFIQSKQKFLPGTLKLYWIPHLKKKIPESANVLGNNYIILQDGKTVVVRWNEASLRCNSIGSSLPILPSKQKQTELIDFIDHAQVPIIFIGLSQIEVSPKI